MVEKLTLAQKRVLREMVEFNCEECGKNETEVGTLEPHRFKRGNQGGKYIPRNIKMVCNDCHKNYHYGEFK